MPKIPTYKYLDDVLKILGFYVARQKGSHVQYVNDKSDLKITVPKHGSKEISIGVFKDILNKLKIDRDEFWKIHKSK